VIGRDATLQGGLLNTGSAYAIPGSSINRTVLAMPLGIAAAWHRMRFELSNTFITREFVTGKPHAWGHFGFQLIF
jgi:hypothetical protein